MAPSGAGRKAQLWPHGYNRRDDHDGVKDYEHKKMPKQAFGKF